MFEYDHFHGRPGKRRKPFLPVTDLSKLSMVLGLILLLIGGILLSIDLDTKSWPTVEGVVQESRVVRGQGEALSFAYRFTVGDYVYRSGGVTPGQSRGIGDFAPDRFDPAKVVQKYPAGTAVTVYYNPADPRDAVLEPGASWLALLSILLGAFLLVLGVVLYLRRPFREIDREEAWEHHARPFG